MIERSFIPIRLTAKRLTSYLHLKDGHGCIERPAAKFPHGSKTKRPGQKSSNPSRRKEKFLRETEEEVADNHHQKDRAQEVRSVPSGTKTK